MERIFALVEGACFQGHTHVPGIFTEGSQFHSPEELAFRVEDWDDTFQLAFDADDPAPKPDFGTAAEAKAYVEEGRAIVLALCDHFGAEMVEVSASFGRDA